MLLDTATTSMTESWSSIATGSTEEELVPKKASHFSSVSGLVAKEQTKVVYEESQ